MTPLEPEFEDSTTIYNLGSLVMPVRELIRPVPIMGDLHHVVQREGIFYVTYFRDKDLDGLEETVRFAHEKDDNKQHPHFWNNDRYPDVVKKTITEGGVRRVLRHMNDLYGVDEKRELDTSEWDKDVIKKLMLLPD